MTFHLYVEIAGEKQPEIVKDIEYGFQVSETYAGPYCRNERFLLNGRLLTMAQIRRFQVFESDCSFATHRKRVLDRASRKGISIIGLPDADAIRELTDVTRQYMESSHDASPTPVRSVPGGSKVFIVHGHDGEMKEATARVVEQHGLAATILHEQPNQGRTIIEKFEDHASAAGFAVILFSPDDDAVSNGKPVKRARQNVIFELGYFHAKLGRGHVAVLHRGDVEILSDYHGVVWIPFDSAGAWKAALKQELTAAGLTG